MDPEEQTLILAIALDGDWGTSLLPLPPRLLRPVGQLLRESLGTPLYAIAGLKFEVV